MTKSLRDEIEEAADRYHDPMENDYGLRRQGFVCGATAFAIRALEMAAESILAEWPTNFIYQNNAEHLRKLADELRGGK